MDRMREGETKTEDREGGGGERSCWEQHKAIMC